MRAEQSILYYSLDTGCVETEQVVLCACDEASQNNVKESNVVGLYPGYRFQVMEGYGCALTEIRRADRL